MRTQLSNLLTLFTALALPLTSHAEAVDPEAYILKNGHQFTSVGADGHTQLYSNTIKVGKEQLASLTTQIASLPKHADTLRACTFLRDQVKAGILRNGGKLDDVLVANHGYEGPIVACTLSYVPNASGDKLIYSKNGEKGIYMLFVVE